MTEHYVEIARASQLKPGRLMRIQYQQRAYMLANVNGEFYLTDDLCTHEEASLSNGALHGDCVSCPLHGGRFNVRTGEPREEPAEEPITTYPVRRDGDRLLAAIG